jgi:putative phosphoribosyl transferase
VIRAASDWTSETQQPFWANAAFILPRHPRALVVLAHHDSAAKQAGIRRQIAEHLAAHQLGTCTVDLTEPDEHYAGRMVVDVETLCERLRGVVQFVSEWDDTRGLPIAVFGEDYCAAAAMMVAAESLSGVKVAGAYCGRPDLAVLQLPQVRTATLLIVPGRDAELLARNERAFSKLECPSQIAVISNATRSLREVGATHACRYLIRRWCQKHAINDNIRALAG